MLLPFADRSPRIDDSALVLPTATVIGDVRVGAEASLWFNVVVRGDVNYIRIGQRTNIQDGSVVHVTRERYPTCIGDDVTVGHNVTLHGCTIGERCLVGIGAILLDGVEVGTDVMIAAGSLVTPGTVLPSGTLVMGSPARPRRDLTVEEIASLRQSAANYVEYLRSYQSQYAASGSEQSID